MSEEKDQLRHKLNKRQSLDSYRSLTLPDPSLIDFSSNDYLGLSRSQELKSEILAAYADMAMAKNGSTGSRLITGTSKLILETEQALARHFHSSSGLVFSSGYMANLAFFSSVPQKHDTLLYDELSHACIKDGARLGTVKKFPFKHNDLDQLEQKLKRATGQIYIACEAVYSMDGDFAPLHDLAALAQRYQARLVVDEAHSTGVFGMNGNGLVNHLGLSDQVFACIYTFGKAMGVHGAFVAGNETLREYLVNFSRPFIYTTAPSDLEVLAMATAVEKVRSSPLLAQKLSDHIQLFIALIEPEHKIIRSESAIQAVLIPGNERVKNASQFLKQKGFDIRPILSPTVKEGEERLRICLHAFNSENEVKEMTLALNAYLSDSLLAKRENF